MRELHCQNRKELAGAIETLTAGDCVAVERFSDVASGAAELLSSVGKIEERGADFVSREENVDTRTEHGREFFRVCRALRALDRAGLAERRQAGIDRAKEEGRYKGRKPIAVDGELFESVVGLWESGQISARQAMVRLDLKPNTFYRRIKEREEQKMKDYKEIKHEIRAEIKEAAKQSRRDLDELKKQVKTEAKEVRKTAEEKLELRDVEREIRRDRARAEAEHNDSVKQMKKDVEAEAKELKKMMEES